MGGPRHRALAEESFCSFSAEAARPKCGRVQFRVMPTAASPAVIQSTVLARRPPMMIRRPLVLAIGTVLVVAACSKKPDAPAGGPAPATPPPATPATPSAAPAGTAAAGQGHNT